MAQEIDIKLFFSKLLKILHSQKLTSQNGPKIPISNDAQNTMHLFSCSAISIDCSFHLCIPCIDTHTKIENIPIHIRRFMTYARVWDEDQCPASLMIRLTHFLKTFFGNFNVSQDKIFLDSIAIQLRLISLYNLDYEQILILLLIEMKHRLNCYTFINRIRKKNSS